MKLEDCHLLVKKSSIKLIEKNEFARAEIQDIVKQLKFNVDLNKFHSDRKNEFILSRVLIYHILKEEYKFEYNEFSSNEDRSPIWPQGFIGSISHSKNLVAVALSQNCKYLGIDLENLGRMKIDVFNKISVDEDIKIVNGLTDEQLMTLIFSAKEALFKALYPEVKKFFGFDYAYVKNVFVDKNSFEICLKKPINELWTPEKRQAITGRFLFDQGHCLAIIEF